MNPTQAAGLVPVRTVLENGVVVLAQENRTIPAIAVNATFDTGAVDDPPHLPGVAYLAGKTIDRGTTLRTADVVADLLDDSGVSLRVSVTRHSVTVSLVCLKADLERMLDLVSELVRRPVFPEEEVEKRRIEAITSLRQDEDNPAVRANEEVLQMLYGPRHPYGRPLKGTIESLQLIDRADLVGFHASNLVSAGLRIAVVGDLDAEEAVDATALAFGEWRRPEPRAAVVAPPPRPMRAVRVLAMPGKSQTDIAYGFPTIRRLDPRFYAYWIMNNVLGQFGLGGRLAENIRERQGMAYYAYSTLEANVGEGPLIIRAGVDPKHIARAFEAIETEVRALRNSGPTPDEFDDTQASLVGGVPRMLETNESIAEFLQNAEQFGLGLDYDRRLPSLIRQVTLDDVREAAREALDPAHAAVAIAGPYEADDPVWRL